MPTTSGATSTTPAMLPALRAGLPDEAPRPAASTPATSPSRPGTPWPQFASFGFCKAHAAAFALPTYQSAWLKTHYRAHFLAGVLTHDPGMYPRRLILDDARRAGIPILPLDVNRSEPEYVVEEVGAPGRAGAGRWGIRLALQDVHGISAGRDPLDRDGARRAGVPGCRGLPAAHDRLAAGDRGARARRRVRRAAGARRTGAVTCTTAITSEAPREGDQLTLDRRRRASHRFADYTDAEVVRAELEVLGLDATRHLVSFFEPLLADLGVTRAADLHAKRAGTST